MTSKELGKITSAEFGAVPDYPFLFGLQLRFSLGSGGSIGCGGKYTVNLSESCKWKSDVERQEAIERCLMVVRDTCKEAKVSHVSRLVGKPVEVEIEGNLFKGFRILTEVL